MTQVADNKKILIITCQGLPEPERPATGGGLRMYGLGEGLKSKGHQVIYSIPETCLDAANPLHAEWAEHSHGISNINARIAQIEPDVVIFGNWGLAFQAETCDLPVIVDMNGSLILENHYRQRGWPIRDDALNKIKSLSKVDLVMAGSQRQKTYFTAWCLMAGLDPDKIAIEVVPFSLSPALPEPTHPGEPQFVMAGYNWPWLKGQRTVETVSRELTRLQRGHLHVYSMAPPFVDALPGEDSSDDFAGYMDVQDLSRVTLHDPVSFDELTSVLCRSSVALDVWGRNLERELAFPTRTVVYLWCGLPVIVSAYSEAYDLVRRYDAGWAMAESDQGRLGKLVEDIVCGRINLRGYKTRAQRLAGDHFLWDKTIESIDAFCRNPVRNRVLSPLFVNRIELEKRLEESLSILEASRRNNDALREDLKKSENVRLDLHREKEAIAGKYAHLEAEAVRMSHLNRHLLADSRLMGRVYRRPKGFARFTSLTLFRLTWKRLIIGLPVLGYLFCLAVGGQFLQNLHLRWKRS